MTIDEAIKILKNRLPYLEKHADPDMLSAFKLSIEALKRCSVIAKNSPLWAAKPLPGETEE